MELRKFLYGRFIFIGSIARLLYRCIVQDTTMFFKNSLLLLAALPFIAAQTTTSCDPLNTTCPADPALGKALVIDFTKGESPYFTENYASAEMSYGSPNGLTMTINNANDSPTLTSNFYIFFGKVEVVVQAAPGVGIVSSVILQSDDLDEIDLEFVGGDNYHAQTNYFYQGIADNWNRGGLSDVTNPTGSFHTYTIDWTRDSLTWAIDGIIVRTVTPTSDPGYGYPQTPMQLKIGSWPAGLSTNAAGTVEWAGGLVDFSQAPFKFYVQSLYVEDYSTGTEYKYTDESGSEDSISAVGGVAGGYTDGPAYSATTVTSYPSSSAAVSSLSSSAVSSSFPTSSIQMSTSSMFTSSAMPSSTKVSTTSIRSSASIKSSVASSLVVPSSSAAVSSVAVVPVSSTTSAVTFHTITAPVYATTSASNSTVSNSTASNSTFTTRSPTITASQSAISTVGTGAGVSIKSFSSALFVTLFAIAMLA